MIGLGPHPLQTLDKARGIAVDNARVAWEGGDPRRQVVKIPTFGEAAELVIAAHVESWKDNGKTEKDWRAILRDYVLPKLGNRRVDQLDTQEVGAVLSPIWNAKRPTAEKARRRISAIMAWAVAQGHRADNPCADLTAILGNGSHKTKHQEALPHAAVGAALATIRASDGWVGARDALEFLILTAARSGEVRGARWDEIDLDAATWAIPADQRTKTGAEHGDSALCAGRSGGDTGSGVRRRQRPCVPERYGARNGGGHSPACPGREQGKGNRPRLPKLIQRLGRRDWR